MAQHKAFTVGVKVYFCDPQSLWQRSSNENTNLLLRQYFPKGTDLSAYSQAQPDSGLAALESTPKKNSRIPDSCR
jgi:IS30 family transposase